MQPNSLPLHAVPLHAVEEPEDDPIDVDHGGAQPELEDGPIDVDLGGAQPEPEDDSDHDQDESEAISREMCDCDTIFAYMNFVRRLRSTLDIGPALHAASVILSGGQSGRYLFPPERPPDRTTGDPASERT